MSKKQRKQGKDELHWPLIRDSLDVYQPERLAAELRRFLSARIPKGTTHIPENQRFALFLEVRDLVSATVGPWCSLSHVELGNDVIGGYASGYFFKGKGPPGPGMDLERNLQHILQALQRSQRWLRRLDEHFRSVKLPEDEQGRQTALSAAVRQTLDITMQETGCEDAWYGYASDAVGWLMESLGFRMTDNLRRVLSKAMADFRSWVGPSEGEAQEISDTVALEVVKKGFAQKYPR